MEKFTSIKISSDNQAIADVLAFVEATKDGKFTGDRPLVTTVNYTRAYTPDQEQSLALDEALDGPLLFGVSS